MFGDLKAAFGQKKDGKPKEEEKMNWDHHVEEKEEEELPESFQPADSSLADRESSGFHFSFFGDEAGTGGAAAGRPAVPQPAAGRVLLVLLTASIGLSACRVQSREYLCNQATLATRPTAQPQQLRGG